jgi:hypothetical protein
LYMLIENRKICFYVVRDIYLGTNVLQYHGPTSKIVHVVKICFKNN